MTNLGREDEVVPEIDQECTVEVDEDVGWSALTDDEFVDAGTWRRFRR